MVMQLCVGLIIILINTYLPFLINNKYPKLFYIGLYNPRWYALPNVCVYGVIWLTIYVVTIVWMLKGTAY